MHIGQMNRLREVPNHARADLARDALSEAERASHAPRLGLAIRRPRGLRMGVSLATVGERLMAVDERHTANSRPAWNAHTR